MGSRVSTSSEGQQVTVQSMDWFLERVEVARENSSTPGHRDVHAGCPVCRSVDNLHITEHNGSARLKSFGCNAKYDDIVAHLSTVADQVAEETQSNDAPAVKAPIIRKRRSAALVTPGDELDWY